MRALAAVIIAYLFGSIPFGYLIVKVTREADIREIGSGGTGATNVSRHAGKAAGLFTLVLDALKGGAAVFVAGWILGINLFDQQIDSISIGQYWWVVAAGVAAIAGHMFPVWLGFRGGKGVATGVGVFLMLAPIAVAMAAVIFLLIVWRSRYVSLGSIVAAALIPLFVWLQDGVIRPVAHPIPTMSAAAAGAILIIFAHRANIRRLIEGSENKLGRRP